MKDETVWLNTEQMAQLFERDYETIRKHINNALKEELENDKSVVAKFAIPLSMVQLKVKLKPLKEIYIKLQDVGERANFQNIKNI